jgi:hypothetical protein
MKPRFLHDAALLKYLVQHRTSYIMAPGVPAAHARVLFSTPLASAPAVLLLLLLLQS